MDCLRVFVLGPARSGTSAILLALHDVFALSGEGESHVIPAFQRAIYQFSVYCEQLGAGEGILARQLDPLDFRDYVIRYMRDFYAKAFPAGGFADKTPGAEAIAGAPLIRLAFPEARIILTRRSGIAVVQSHVGKFNVEFAEACRGWAACMQAIQEARPATTDLLELDQQELATAPEEAAIRLCRYLRRPERSGELARYFRANRADSSSQHDWGRTPRLDDTGWTDAQKQTFREICGAHMAAFGYAM